MMDFHQIASGFYLTEQFPDNTDDWSEEQFTLWMEDHVLDIYEYWPTNDVWELIDVLAHTLEAVAKEAIKHHETTKGDANA